MYIYMYIYILIKSQVGPILLKFRLTAKFPDEPERRNFRRKGPTCDLIFVVGSTWYWALSVIVALQHFTVFFFSFGQLIAYLLIFFSLFDEVGLFFFFFF